MPTVLLSAHTNMHSQCTEGPLCNVTRPEAKGPASGALRAIDVSDAGPNGKSSKQASQRHRKGQLAAERLAKTACVLQHASAPPRSSPSGRGIATRRRLRP